MKVLRRAVLVLLAAGPAAAQGNLYGDQPPPGSAFVRFVNALPGGVSVRPDFLPAVTIGNAGPARIGAYGTVTGAAGRTLNAEFRAPDGAVGRVTLRAEPASYVTVLVRAEGGRITATPIVDAASFDQSRALLAFYNALPGCPAAGLSIDGGAAVFADVPPSEARRRIVNPVVASLRAACGERSTAPFPLGGMEAGGRFSAWILPGEGGPEGFVTRDPVPGGWQPGR